jgi:hypothetical protein
MGECEWIADELLLLATQQWSFRVLGAKEEYREAHHKAECLRISEEVQGIIESLNERLAGVWRLNYGESTVRLCQHDSASALFTTTLDDRTTGIIGVTYNAYKDDEVEEFTLDVSREETFFWRYDGGRVLTSAALAEHCLAKTLQKAEKLLRSYVQEVDHQLRAKLKIGREVQGTSEV